MITIFTPTYNRAHTLPRLYESLKNQTSKDFEWLIVDDGSTDSTEQLVREFSAEERFEIRYIKQENKGKHFAINHGLKNALGDYFVNIDSDDYLVRNAVEVIEKLVSKVETTKYAGFSFIHFADNVKYNPNDFGNRTWQKEEQYIWRHHGEMMFCIKTDIYSKFPFPEFEGEKFCPESLVLRRIERKHKILYTNYVLAKGDYLQDGLTANYFKMMMNSPRGSLLRYKEQIDETVDKNLKLSLANRYYEIALSTNKITLKEKYFTLNPFLTFKVFLNKILKN